MLDGEPFDPVAFGALIMYYNRPVAPQNPEVAIPLPCGSIYSTTMTSFVPISERDVKAHIL